MCAHVQCLVTVCVCLLENVLVLLISTLFSVVQQLKKVHKWASVITLAASLTCADMHPPRFR